MWTVTAVKKASCAVGDEVVVLSGDVRPGDLIECHGVRQRVTYECGTYALVKLEGSTSHASGPQTGSQPS
ncbi:MAG: hypothetical protein HY725_15555 [Candidatus Rokubacteria bacterium]|nr:hypothetical protein [Candidatus Rokubacteria bacterium]